MYVNIKLLLYKMSDKSVTKTKVKSDAFRESNIFPNCVLCIFFPPLAFHFFESFRHASLTLQPESDGLVFFSGDLSPLPKVYV